MGAGKLMTSLMIPICTVLRRARRNIGSAKMERKFASPFQGLPQIPLERSSFLKATMLPAMG